MKYFGLLGRFLFGLIFLTAGPSHFKVGTIAFAGAQGVPWPSLAVPLSGIIAMLGALSIILGYRAKWGAWLLVLFLVPVTLSMHRFWGIADHQMAMLQQIMFMKNVAMLGAALLIATVGSGPLSLKQIRD